MRHRALLIAIALAIGMAGATWFAAGRGADSEQIAGKAAVVVSGNGNLASPLTWQATQPLDSDVLVGTGAALFGLPLIFLVFGLCMRGIRQATARSEPAFGLIETL